MVGESSLRAPENQGIVNSNFVNGTSMTRAAMRERPLKSSLSHQVWLVVLIWCGAPIVSSKNWIIDPMALGVSGWKGWMVWSLYATR